MEAVDYMVCATSIEADIQKINAVKLLLEEYPVEVVGGMPYS